MAYQIIYKKRFSQKFFKLLNYLKKNWGESVADNFIDQLQTRLSTLLKQPYIGAASLKIKTVRSILVTKHNRVFYRIKGNQIEVIKTTTILHITYGE